MRDASRQLTLHRLAGQYSVCFLDPGTHIAPVTGDGFYSVTHTTDEISIVCKTSQAPESRRREDGWTILEVEGPLNFQEIGIIARLSALLADAGVSIFVVSTFETDYLLVKEAQFDRAVTALEVGGCVVNV